MAARRKKKGGVLSTLVAVIVIVILVLYNQFVGFGGERATEVVEGTVEIYIFDVGQADCTLIRGEAGNILIDAGDTDTQDEIVETVRSAGVTELEYVIFTHPDSDHIGGTDEIVNGFDLGVEGYSSLTVNGKYLNGAGWIVITKDNMSDYNF